MSALSLVFALVLGVLGARRSAPGGGWLGRGGPPGEQMSKESMDALGGGGAYGIACSGFFEEKTASKSSSKFVHCSFSGLDITL